MYEHNIMLNGNEVEKLVRASKVPFRLLLRNNNTSAVSRIKNEETSRA